MKSAKPRIIIAARNFPLPGGRTAFINTLLASKLSQRYSFELLTWQQFGGRPKTKHLFEIKEFARKSFSWLEQHGSDIKAIIAIGASALGAAEFGAKFRIPVFTVLSDTELSSVKMHAKGIRRMIASYLIRAFEKKTFMLSTRIVLPSNYSLSEFLKYYPAFADKAIIIPEAKPLIKPKKIDIRKLLNIPESSTVVLFNRFSERKNVSAYLSIIPEVARRGVHTIFIGKPGNVSNEVQKQLDSAYGKVHFIEPTEDQLPSCFLAANAVVYPVLSEAHSYTILEAMNYGIPVIASASGWIKQELGAEYELYCDPKRPETILTALDRFLSNQGHFKKQTKGFARSLNLKYNYAKMIGSWQQLLASAGV